MYNWSNCFCHRLLRLLLICFFFIEKDSVRKLFQSFQSAWELVRHQLSSQGMNNPSFKHTRDVVKVTLRTLQILQSEHFFAVVVCRVNSF